METHAHSFFTWAFARHGMKAGRAAGISGAVGAALPDMPAFAAAAYYFDKSGSMPREQLLDAIYFTGPFGATGGLGAPLHRPGWWSAGAALELRLGCFDEHRVLLWFLLGWAGHTVVDFLTHVDDLRLLFWPLSDWRWASPVSYYNPRYYGREFMLVSHASMLVIMAVLLRRRLREGRGRK